ncbi:indolepyruvate oxidoreductase subunit beta [Desulfosporosinus metallidurans]|uniref:Indolepyruvate oxidoreductase subunit IorB n=1 Tax=Desulfosporosinus metallidurans TaxID=1888891 RepID=A0A1Q8QHR5_9FIRM|nr:indolepyruvate oxidoreductase subunit beta [Desulfosporosinus metallidurans]OLN26884.1 Indolepyruvate oxidoreductase subunit IorB [Desulfosporosinus metallidurans]
MTANVLNIIVTGVGGQGNVLASQVIATAAVDSGYYVSVGETFGASQRGGSVTSHIRVSQVKPYGPLISRGEADFILGFEPLETLRTYTDYGNALSQIIMNVRPNYPLGVLLNEDRYPDISGLTNNLIAQTQKLWALEATELAVGVGVPVGTNMVMTGAFAGVQFLPIPLKVYETVLKGLFAGEILDLNLAAFRAGVKAVRPKGRA